MPPLWVWLLILLYVVLFSALSLRKHNTFNSFTLDLGIMSQVTWNTAHGRLFETSLDRAQYSDLIGSYMGNHVRPILLLLAPLYRLFPDPRTLLVLQSLVLGLGAVPLFWIARRDLKTSPVRVGIIISYLLYPALGFISLFDFHPVAFCVPALLMAYWALREERDVLFWGMIILSLSTKEELAVPVAALGIYCLTRRKWRSKGLWLLGIAALWVFACLFIVIPYYNEGRPYRFLKLWQHLLVVPGFRNGGAMPATGAPVFSVDVVYFVLHLLLPLGFLPLLAPGLSALSLPSLGYLITSSRPALHQVGNQYPAVLIPWLFLAAIKGLSRLEHWPWANQHARRWLPLSLLVLATVGAQLPFNPIFVSWRSGYFSTWGHDEAVRQALARIPPDAGVATINSLGAQLTQRRVLIGLDKYEVALNQNHLAHADYVLLDLVDCRLFHTADPREDYGRMVQEILDTRWFEIEYWSDRVLLLRRGDPKEAELDKIRAYVSTLLKEQRPCWP